MRYVVSLLLIFLLAEPIAAAQTAAADTMQNAHASDNAVLLDHFSFDFRNLTYGLVQKPVNSVLNPDNRQEVPRYTLASDFRPDFAFNISRLNMLLKPRFDFAWKRCEDGVCDGQEDNDPEYYVNEWLVRVEPVDSLFLSYGRENLQWGPSLLLSPSNPFYTDNGRNNPKMEVPGADYGRVVWSPNIKWTGSFIVNTDEGRQEQVENFDPTYAVKIDHTADQGYFSLIFAKRQEATDTHLGLFGSWNLNDAWVVYTEDSLREGDIEALVGGSYTFGNGSTLTVEYFYNGSGNRDDDLLDIIASGNGPDERLMLFRKNYLLVQYYYRDMFDRWNGLLRATASLDDQSAAVLGLIEYNLGPNVQLFATGTLFGGDDTDEFGSLLDYRAMAGLEFSF